MLNDRQHAQSLRRLVLTEYKPNDLNDEPDDAFWPWLGDLKGERSDKKSANKFMLGAILDYQIRADVAWENARRLAENEFGDPVSLWEIITSIPKSRWNSRFKRYSLHRFPKAHERVWRIGRELVQRYGGDARRIWDSQPAAEVFERLISMRAGPQISRMIVGALYDTGQIKDLGDLKADLHVRRVLGRVFTGRHYILWATTPTCARRGGRDGSHPSLARRSPSRAPRRLPCKTLASSVRLGTI